MTFDHKPVLTQAPVSSAGDLFVNRRGDAAILSELDQIRETAKFLGTLPAFRRARLVYDFASGTVAAAVDGGATC